MGCFCRDHSGLGFLSLLTGLIMLYLRFCGLMRLRIMNSLEGSRLELLKIVGLGGNWKNNEVLFRELKFLASSSSSSSSWITMIDLLLLISFCELGTF